MISANELRIGNWICGQNDPPMTVMSIDKHGIEAYFFESEADNWYYEIKDVRGIPITEEIVKNLNQQQMTDAGVALSFKEHEYWIDHEYQEAKVKGLAKVEFVHEFQNAFHALTGTELEINL